MKKKTWMGSAPIKCDLCKNPLDKTFIDGNTRYGVWANMCPLCHKEKGMGLGEGRGQSYELQENGQWLKTGG